MDLFFLKYLDFLNLHLGPCQGHDMIKAHKGLFFTASNKVIWLKKKFYAFTPKILSRMPFKYSRAIIIDASIISPPHNEAEIVLKLHSNLHIQSWGPNLGLFIVRL